jgi:hypothetical protein
MEEPMKRTIVLVALRLVLAAACGIAVAISNTADQGQIGSIQHGPELVAENGSSGGSGGG